MTQQRNLLQARPVQPQRTCIACGAKNSPDALLRIRHHGGALAFCNGRDGRSMPGRSAYICRRAACVDSALAKRAFERSFRAKIYVSDAVKQGLRAALDAHEHG